MDTHRIAIIASVCAGCTLVTMLFLGRMAWTPIQLCISWVLTVLALLVSDAVPGIGEAAVLNLLGLPHCHALARSPLAGRLASDDADVLQEEVLG